MQCVIRIIPLIGSLVLGDLHNWALSYSYLVLAVNFGHIFVIWCSGLLTVMWSLNAIQAVCDESAFDIAVATPFNE